MMILTVDYLKTILRYEPDSGDFFWLVDLGTARAGRQAGATRPDGYVVIRIHKKLYYAHRLAWLYMTGEWPPRLVDHDDRDASNNRWSNLRCATRSQNNANSMGRQRNQTGWKGVICKPCKTRLGRPFVAQGSFNGKCTYLGAFRTPEEAQEAYMEYMTKLHGQFARAFVRAE